MPTNNVNSLIEAVIQNDGAAFSRFLDPKTVNEVDRNGRGALHFAALYGHIHFIAPLLKAGADVNKRSHRDDNYRTPIYIAAENGHENIITALIVARKNVNIEAETENGRTPVYVAAELGHTKALTVLIAAGADVNKKGWDGKRPIYIAAENGHAEVVTVLAAAKAKMNTKRPDGKKPIHIAAENGSAGAVSALVAAGADVDEPWEYGFAYRTPIYIAAENGHAGAITALAAARANMETSGPEGKTPVYIAAENLHVEAITALAASRANMDAPGPYNQTPVYAVALRVHEDVNNKIQQAQTITVLAAVGAEISEVGPNGQTPAYVAAQRENIEALNALINSGANVNIRNEDEDGETPIYAAVRQGNMEILNVLIEAQAEINMGRNDGATPLHIAAQVNNVKAINILIAAGAAIDAVNSNGETPLHIAAEKRKVEAIRTLLEAGANARATDFVQGITALEIAEQAQYTEVSTLLIEHLEKYPNGIKPQALVQPATPTILPTRIVPTPAMQAARVAVPLPRVFPRADIHAATPTILPTRIVPTPAIQAARVAVPLPRVFPRADIHAAQPTLPHKILPRAAIAVPIIRPVMPDPAITTNITLLNIILDKLKKNTGGYPYIEILKRIGNNCEDAQSIANVIWIMIKEDKGIESHESQNFDQGFQDMLYGIIDTTGIVDQNKGKIASILQENWGVIVMRGCIEHAQLELFKLTSLVTLAGPVLNPLPAARPIMPVPLIPAFKALTQRLQGEQKDDTFDDNIPEPENAIPKQILPLTIHAVPTINQLQPLVGQDQQEDLEFDNTPPTEKPRERSKSPQR